MSKFLGRGFHDLNHWTDAPIGGTSWRTRLGLLHKGELVVAPPRSGSNPQEYNQTENLDKLKRAPGGRLKDSAWTGHPRCLIDVADGEVSISFGLGPAMAFAPEVLPSVGRGVGGFFEQVGFIRCRRLPRHRWMSPIEICAGMLAWHRHTPEG